MLAREVIEKYAWVNEIETWTLAVVRGRSLSEVIEVYGGDPRSPVGEFTFAQMADLQGDPVNDLKFHVQVFERENHVVALENNGWSGCLPEIARRCSVDGGQFFSVYWNVNAFGYLTEAIDGKITAHFESLYPFDPDPPQPGDVRPEWAVGEELDVETSAWPACVALLEQQTGVEIDPLWLTAQRPTFRIPNPHFLYRDVANADRV